MKVKILNILQNRIFWIVLMSIVYMQFLPEGSFNPTRYGFYRSVFMAIVMDMIFNWSACKSWILKLKHRLTSK